MLFNAKKCKCLHFGHANADASYFTGGAQVEIKEYEEDLHVLIENSLSPNRQFTKFVISARYLVLLLTELMTVKK